MRHSILNSISATIGPVPHVLLRDTAPGEEPGPRKPRTPPPRPTERARAERRLRRFQMGLAASLLVLTDRGGPGNHLLHPAAIVLPPRAVDPGGERVARVVGEASTLRYQAVARSGGCRAVARAALAAVHQAREAAAGDPAALEQLEFLRKEVQSGSDATERDRSTAPTGWSTSARPRPTTPTAARERRRLRRGLP